MYKICGYTNYECVEGAVEQFGEYQVFETAFDVFKKLSTNPEALNLEELDKRIEEWMQDPNWENNIYFGGYYGGFLSLMEVTEDPCDWDREIFVAHRQRYPITKEIVLGPIELGEGVRDEEGMLL